MIYGWLYRSLMKFAHKFDWHYAPVIGPIGDGKVPLSGPWVRESIYFTDPYLTPACFLKKVRSADAADDYVCD